MDLAELVRLATTSDNLDVVRKVFSQLCELDGVGKDATNEDIFAVAGRMMWLELRPVSRLVKPVLPEKRRMLIRKPRKELP